MPNEDSPPRTEHHSNLPPDMREDDEDSRYQIRECRVCETTISDPLPNQYECLECEDLKERLGGDGSNIVETDSEGPEDPSILPDNETVEGGGVGSEASLQRAIEASNLPPLEIRPSNKEIILERIEGAGNEEKFRTLHIEGEYDPFYPEDEYDKPFEIAVRGYLSIVAFYTRLSVLHMESFYRSSALYDSDFWNGWTRLELLEDAVDFQTQRDERWRIYGSEETFEERLAQSKSRLQLLERQIDR